MVHTNAHNVQISIGRIRVVPQIDPNAAFRVLRQPHIGLFEQILFGSGQFQLGLLDLLILRCGCGTRCRAGVHVIRKDRWFQPVAWDGRRDSGGRSIEPMQSRHTVERRSPVNAHAVGPSPAPMTPAPRYHIALVGLLAGDMAIMTFAILLTLSRDAQVLLRGLGANRYRQAPTKGH